VAARLIPAAAPPRIRTPRRIHRLASTDRASYADLLATADLHRTLPQWYERATPVGDAPADRSAELVQECALLDAILRNGGDRLLVWLRPLGGRAHALVAALRDAYIHLFNRQYGFVATHLAGPGDRAQFVLLEMPGIASILAGEVGAHLLYPPGENVLPVPTDRHATPKR